MKLKKTKKSFQWPRNIAFGKLRGELIKHSITVFSCVVIIALGITALTYADPVTTTIGENISTNSLTSTGLTVNGNATTTGTLNAEGGITINGMLIATNSIRVADIKSVESYGAVGDGTTDDALAIQDAIDAVEAAGGGTVKFTSGKTYALGAGLTIDNNNVTLLGYGATLSLQDNSDPTAVVAIAGSDGSEISNIQILGLTINHNYGDQVGGNAPRGIKVTYAYYVLLDSVTVINSFVSIEFADGATYGEVRHCYTTGYYNDGFEISGTNASDANDPQYIVLTDCHAHSAQVGANNAFEIEDGAKDITVIGCSGDKSLEIRNHDVDNTGTTENIYVTSFSANTSILVNGRTGRSNNTVQNIFIYGVESSGGVSVNDYAQDVSIISENEMSIFDGSLFINASTGKVGIGTTSPSNKLDVNGDIAVPFTSKLRVGSFAGGTEIGYLGNSIGIMQLRTVSNRDIQIGAEGIDTIFIEGSNGNVGIGTTTPDTLFHVSNGTATTTITIGDELTGGKGACLKLRDSDDNGWTYCSVLNGVMTCGSTSCE